MATGNMAMFVNASLRGNGKGADALSLRSLLPALTTAPITALLTIITCISYPAVIFTGPLSNYYSVGVGLAFVSAIVLTLIVFLTSSYPGSLAYAQAEPAVIVGVIVQGMATSLIAKGAPQQVLPTFLAAVSVSSILCGLCFALLGWLRCGDLIRFLPFPVVGGFLGGVGWLLVGKSLTAAIPPALSTGLPAALLRGEALIHWLPVVGSGFALWLLQERRSHYLNLPIVLGIMVTLFWSTAVITGSTMDHLRSSGWLFSGLPKGSLWSPSQHVIGLGRVAWSLFPSHALEFVTLLVVTTVALLLTANSIELSVGRDIDFNRELRWLGLGNVVVGLLGALPGFHSTSGSILTHRLHTPWRVVGLLTALICLGALLVGPRLLSVMPKMVAGTVLFYVGLGFMFDWLYKTWFRIHPADYFVLLVVFAVVAFVGLIEGLVIGIAVGLVIFVLRYSRIDAARNIASGATIRSNVERTEEAKHVLKRSGDSTFIITLQGYIFFGTSHRLLNLIRQRIFATEDVPVHFLVLDFQLVNGLDSSAAASFTKLVRYSREKGFTVLLAGMSEDVVAVFRREGLFAASGDAVRIFSDLDRALEWGEDRLLEMENLFGSGDMVPIEKTLDAIFPDEADKAAFLGQLTSYDFGAEDTLVTQGAVSDDLLFIESGRVEVRLEMSGKDPVRLRSMEPGTVVGDIAFYLGVPRSASVVATQPGRIYRLSRTGLDQLERERPSVARAFHRYMAQLLAGKLSDMNAMLAALVR